MRLLGHGKDEYTDIVYTTEENIHHQVQIFGLYAGYKNTVTLETSSGAVRDFNIWTEPLPGVMTNVELVTDEAKPIGDRLFYLCDKWRTVFDINGDVRWYMANISTAFSGIDVMDPASHSFWFSTEGSSSSMATVFCMSFTGRVRGKFFVLGKSAHHDADLLPDGRLMYLSKWRGETSELSILDPEDGSLTTYYDPQEIFDTVKASLEYQTKDHEWDFTHANAVEYIEANNSLLLSFRNQHTILNIDYDTKEIKWALTPAYTMTKDGQAKAIQEKLTEHLVLPASDDSSFAWFYSQHSPQLIQYDPENETYDIVLFDNGTDRFLAFEEEKEDRNQEKYSRIVRYRIDAENRTVTQIYEYGGDYPDYYSEQCGSAQYLPDLDYYVGNFPGPEYDDTRVSVVTVSDGEGEVVETYEITNTSDGTYRCYAYDTAAYAQTENVLGNPGEYMEKYDLLDKVWTLSDYKKSEGSEQYKVREIELTKHGLTIRGTILGEEEKNRNHRFRLIATDENGRQYTMVLIGYRLIHFYMPGINMDNLPPGRYRLGIFAERDKEPMGYTEIPYIYTTDGYKAMIEPAAGAKEEQNTTNWDVQIQEVQIRETLETVVPVTQYDGSIDDVPYTYSASEGSVLVLLNLQVSKSGKGSGGFSWKNVLLRDENGNAFERMNDTFLSDHEYERMAGTDIRIGSKTGWISFEVPKELADQNLELYYQDENGEMILSIEK
ncbi:MAG: aryl-sulfate sulfotransferase [Blautia sp.]|nr:aryl-sulfate sulfotransferase [Blautia sp.]